WLAHTRSGGGRWVLVTRGAVAVECAAEDGAPAAVWGLRCSAPSEPPGRFRLVDLDGSGPDWAALLDTDGPQLAVRDGKLFAPRLVKAAVGESAAVEFDAEGT
ncbi:hypothetical protein VM98_38805, partial [Streptomyces rubellomurinus subsp. indigoferus]